MKRQFSAGGIVFNNQNQVLLVQNSATHYWGFPKGWIEKGQTSEGAALREVKEEGGVEAKIIQKVGDSKFVFTDQDKEKVFKVVNYFLMEYLSGDPKNHDWEISEAGWFALDAAQQTLSFSEDKKLLNKALEIKGQKLE